MVPAMLGICPCGKAPGPPGHIGAKRAFPRFSRRRQDARNNITVILQIIILEIIIINSIIIVGGVSP
jgi:hypothetical protein